MNQQSGHSPGRVRIIGGQWRRRWLPVPAGAALRPTPDRVRETLFNWLAPSLLGARCLDLFAGSGVLGLEAISRGAAHATLVEHDRELVTQLRTNVALLAAEEAVRVIESEALRFLATPSNVIFNVVFLDPPYASGLVARVLPLLTPQWLTPAALVYLETAREQPLVPLPEGWRMIRVGETSKTRYCLAQTGG